MTPILLVFLLVSLVVAKTRSEPINRVGWSGVGIGFSVSALLSLLLR